MVAMIVIIELDIMSVECVDAAQAETMMLIPDTRRNGWVLLCNALRVCTEVSAG